MNDSTLLLGGLILALLLTGKNEGTRDPDPRPPPQPPEPPPLQQVCVAICDLPDYDDTLADVVSEVLADLDSAIAQSLLLTHAERPNEPLIADYYEARKAAPISYPAWLAQTAYWHTLGVPEDPRQCCKINDPKWKQHRDELEAAIRERTTGAYLELLVGRAEIVGDSEPTAESIRGEP